MSRVVLVDMDNTIADFNRRVYETMDREYPDVKRKPNEEMKSASVIDHYPSEYKDKIKKIYNAPDFTTYMQPIDGAVGALLEMVASGMDVMICTAPLYNAPHCQTEKQEWVKKYLGADWTSRLVMTRDKSLVAGAVLIDDAPKVKGEAMAPMWKHILYDQPYNRFVEDKPRISIWSDWRRVLKDFIDVPP